MANKKKENSEFTKQDKALIGTFILLIILVSVLGAVVLNLNNIEKNNDSELTIPIIENSSDNEISIEVEDMEKTSTKEYIFKVTNYKDKQILQKALTYDVGIIPSENTSVKVYKNNSSDNLITENDLLIENNKIKANKKQEDIYKLVINAKETPKKKEIIRIKISS